VLFRSSPLRPRTELVHTTDKYKTYRVLLDVTDGVEVYGNLLVPQGIQGRAPAMVCQHGLSGTPEMITGLGQSKDTPYHEFGRRLAERGYVVFAPLILHRHPVELTNDQARMADSVGAMRVAMAVAKTHRVTDFLRTLPFANPERIGYYGLSYGGYSALWIPPLERRLKAIVVSGHFNDWRSKITSDATRTSYLQHPDEDFYNWNVLHRFTHVEMVTLMAPRAVCIEYGRRDGITTPAWTAYAWKQLSAIRDHLEMQDRIVLAEFDGVHEVRGAESFEFLDRHLKPSP
jgi:dienelactone hydrolase